MVESYPGHAYAQYISSLIGIAPHNRKKGWKKESECWPWYGTKGPKGYGKTALDGKFISAHRLMAVRWLGMKPDDELHVLHRCDNPSCVNPTHLFLGTNRENQLDSVAKGRHGCTSKTHCHNGHPYNEENTVIVTRHDKGGRTERICKTCRRINQYRHRENLQRRNSHGGRPST